jgi:hypothetical protein
MRALCRNDPLALCLFPQRKLRTLFYVHSLAEDFMDFL